MDETEKRREKIIRPHEGLGEMIKKFV